MKLIVILLICSIILISGCSKIADLTSSDSLKDISQNPDKYINKEVSVTAKYDWINDIITDSNGYYIKLDNSCLEKGRQYTSGEVYTFEGYIEKRDYPYGLIKTVYYLTCSPIPTNKLNNIQT